MVMIYYQPDLIMHHGVFTIWVRHGGAGRWAIGDANLGERSKCSVQKEQRPYYAI